MNTTITSVAGLEAGHHTDRRNATGCTVVICRQGAVGGVDVRGGSPGTRETDLLRPSHRVGEVHAVLLSGGSAFGLDAASGVVDYLAKEGIGFKTGPALVPIVSAAILFDLGLITSEVRPGPQDGYAACLAASTTAIEEGTVGAGTGATVAKMRGMGRSLKSGIGSASISLPGGAVVAAVVAVNAYGGVVDHRSGKVIAGPRREDGHGLDDPVAVLLQGATGDGPALTNTTIGVVATNVRLTKPQAGRLATVAHDGLALAVRPAHTMHDGDTIFALATGQSDQPADMNRLSAAAVTCVARAIVRGVRQATGMGGIPSIRELSG